MKKVVRTRDEYGSVRERVAVSLEPLGEGDDL